VKMANTAIRRKKSVSQHVGNFFVRSNDEGQTLYCGGKSSGEWGRILFFYLVFYLLLTAFWASMCSVMVNHIPAWSNGPQLQSFLYEEEPININMAPGRFSDARNINFGSKDSAWVAGSANALDAYVKKTDQGGADVLDDVKKFCSTHEADPADESCGDSSVEANDNYGYDTPRPCFVLSINRIRSRELRGHNHAADLRDQGTDFAKIATATNGFGNFIPMECFLSEEKDLFATERNHTFKFDVRSYFLNEDDVVEHVPGLQFIPFMNGNETRAMRYRNPAVVVRARKSPTCDKDKTQWNSIKNVQCVLRTESNPNWEQRVIQNIIHKK